MTMTSSQAKFQVIIELFELSQRAFLHKLKKKHPNLTEEETASELRKWYQLRPGAELGDAEGIPGDLSRFD